MTHWFARLLKHRRLDESDTRRLLGAGTPERIEARVAASEQQHSGQIRVCVEAGLPLSYLRRHATPRERAVALFGKLRVWDTRQRNGVLIYLLLAERAIEIVADRGLEPVIDAAGWQRLLETMRAAFREGRFEAGLDQAVDAAGTLLARHFPRVPGESNRNELPDAPVLR